MSGRRLLARDFGRVAAFKPHHAPFALRRALLDELSKRYADEVEATMHHRFRHPDDLSVAASLAGNYGIATGQAVTGSLSVEYVHLESARLRWHLDRLLLGRRFDTFCVNETETASADRDRAATVVAEFLAEYFPVPAPWERVELSASMSSDRNRVRSRSAGQLRSRLIGGARRLRASRPARWLFGWLMVHGYPRGAPSGRGRRRVAAAASASPAVATSNARRPVPSRRAVLRPGRNDARRTICRGRSQGGISVRARGAALLGSRR